MQNIAAISDDLKNFSMEQLVQAMQSGSAPQFLVLSEITDRKKKMAAAQGQGQPAQGMSVKDEAMQGIGAMRSAPAAGIGAEQSRRLAGALAPDMQAMNTQNGSMEPFSPQSITSRETPIEQQRFAEGGPVVRGGRIVSDGEFTIPEKAEYDYQRFMEYLNSINQPSRGSRGRTRAGVGRTALAPEQTVPVGATSTTIPPMPYGDSVFGAMDRLGIQSAYPRDMGPQNPSAEIDLSDSAAPSLASISTSPGRERDPLDPRVFMPTGDVDGPPVSRPSPIEMADVPRVSTTPGMLDPLDPRVMLTADVRQRPVAPSVVEPSSQTTPRPENPNFAPWVMDWMNEMVVEPTENYRQQMDVADEYERWANSQANSPVTKAPSEPLDPENLLPPYPSDQRLNFGLPPAEVRGLVPSGVDLSFGDLSVGTPVEGAGPAADTSGSPTGSPPSQSGSGGGAGGGVGGLSGIYEDYRNMLQQRLDQMDQDTSQNRWLMVAKFGADLIGRLNPSEAAGNAAENFLALRQQNQDQAWALQEQMMKLRLDEASARAAAARRASGSGSSSAEDPFTTGFGRRIDELRGLLNDQQAIVDALSTPDEITGLPPELTPEQQAELYRAEQAVKELRTRIQDEVMLRAGASSPNIIEVPTGRSDDGGRGQGGIADFPIGVPV